MKIHLLLWALVGLGIVWLVQTLGPLLIGAALAYGLYRYCHRR